MSKVGFSALIYINEKLEVSKKTHDIDAKLESCHRLILALQITDISVLGEGRLAVEVLMKRATVHTSNKRK